MNSREFFIGLIGFGFGALFMTITLFVNAHNEVEKNQNLTLKDYYGFEISQKEGK